MTARKKQRRLGDPEALRSRMRVYTQKYRDANRSNLAYKAARSLTSRKQYVLKPEEMKARVMRTKYLSLLRRCNSSLTQFLAQIHFQDHRCPICRHRFDEIKTRYNPRTLEHSHSEMRFRGVTCNSCNLILGHAKDNPIVLQSAILYLEGR